MRLGPLLQSASKSGTHASRMAIDENATRTTMEMSFGQGPYRRYAVLTPTKNRVASGWYFSGILKKSAAMLTNTSAPTQRTCAVLSNHTT